MNQSRTRNVARNIVFVLGSQMINLVIMLVSRTVFINILGVEYLGVNGLYTNILTILSFAELGIGNAIIFNMYKPIATGETEKIKSLMAFYRKTYRTIAIVVLVSGICVIPFLDFIIKDAPTVNENLILLYLLFLTNTVVSYFYAYKKSIFIADQKNYIIVYITQLFQTIQVVAQVIILYITHDFVLYLTIQIIFTALGNVAIAMKSNRLYPLLKEKATPLAKEETGKIFKNVRALFVYKFGSVILNGTDNIIISSMVGIASVGLVSNYFLFTSACTNILWKINESFTGSVGNLNATGSRQQKYDVFRKIFFISAWLYGFATVGLIIMSNRVITVWIGSEYLLSELTVSSIMIGFYVSGVHFAAYTYRTTLGYFVEGKIAPIIAAFLNIILSIIGGHLFGIAGIIIATPIARYLTMGLVDPYLIYSKSFELSSLRYHLIYFKYIFVFIIIYFISEFMVSKISISGWAGIILQIISLSFVFNIMMILIFYKTKMFQELYEVVKKLLKRK